MKTNTEFNSAVEVLEYIHTNEDSYSLNSIGWNQDNMVAILTGRITVLSVIMKEPLSEDEAKKTVLKYYSK